jgi:hypothetical protein
MIKIDKITKAEIEQAIGKSLPDPQNAEFEAFYEWLAREHPDLAQKLEGGLEVTEPYPEETAQKQAQRREGIANAIQRMFYKRVWGKRVLNRRALSVTIFFLIFGAMMTSWSFTLFRKHSRIESTQQTMPPKQTPAQQTDVATTATTPLEGKNLLIVPEAQVKDSFPNESTPPANAQLTAPADISDTAPPRTLPEAVGSRPLQPPLIPQPLEVAESEPDPIPQTAVLQRDEESSTPMSEFSVAAFEPVELATQPIVIESLETVASERQPVLAFGDEEGSTQAPAIAEVSPSRDMSANAAVVPTETELATNSVLAFGSEETSMQSSPNAEASLAGEERAATKNAPSEWLESSPAQEINSELPPPQGNTAESTALLETDIFDGNVSDLLNPGMLISAVLQKDIILTQGETRQVLADAVEDWCGETSCPVLRWLGTATLSAGGRLDVTFNQAILEGEVLELSGIAYGADNAEGLPAHIADTTPTLLADLLRAGAGGVTDYVEGQANRQTVTQSDGTTVTEENVPGLLEFILGRAAGTLQVPEGETSVIRLAAVEKGTRLEVLYLEE